MRGTLRCLLLTALLVAVGAPAGLASPAAPAGGDSSLEVVQIWACELRDGTTEEQVEALAKNWLKAIRALPGGASVKMRVFFPAVASGNGETDFYFVMLTPTFADWGKIWDSYTDDTAAAMAEDVLGGKVDCPDSMLWEAHEVSAN